MVLAGTVGVLGAGYFGYHRSVTGETIQRLVPEWQAEEAGQAKSAPAAGTCNQAPAPVDLPTNVPGPGFSFNVPGHRRVCGIFKRLGGDGSLGVYIRSRIAANVARTAETCMRSGKDHTPVSVGMTFCGLEVGFSGNQYMDRAEHRCRRCTTPPRHSCEGLKCRLTTLPAVRLNSVANINKNIPIIPGALSANASINSSRLVASYSMHEVKNGTDRACGNCRDEVIPGRPANEPRQDCVKHSFNLPIGSSTTVSLVGAGRLGPINLSVTGSGSFTFGAQYVRQTGACGARHCWSAEAGSAFAIRLRGTAEVGGVTHGLTAYEGTCGGTWRNVYGEGCQRLGSQPSAPTECNDQAWKYDIENWRLPGRRRT